MAAGFKFTFNHAGMDALLNSPEMEMDLHERVIVIADEAERIAPYSERDTEEEHYRDSIEPGTFVDEWTGAFGQESRITGYVRANVPWACTVEVKHRTLGTALSGNEG